MNRIYWVILAFIVVGLTSFLGFAQNPIPNPGFENWTMGNPDGWYTSNAPGFNAITQSSTAHSGVSAMRGEVLNGGGFPIPPYAYTGSQLDPGFSVSQRYSRLTGYYQFSPASANDSLSISVAMVKDGIGIGAGNLFIHNPASSYMQFSADIVYGPTDVPDTCVIYVTILSSTGLPTVGSTFLLDDLAFSVTSDIRKKEDANLVQEFQLKQNYPNPFNPTTNIEFSIPKLSNVKLIIYNQLGQTVATLVNERLSAGNYSVDWNAEGFPSGVYFYRITAGDFTQTRKLLFTK
jgi:hypothetical protein